MPCDIGYRSWAVITIPKPTYQKFKKKVSPPKVDTDLLSKIGEDDPEFLDWLNGLDVQPLLKEALKRAKKQVRGSSSLRCSVLADGSLVMTGKYADSRKRGNLENLSEDISRRYQMEVLAIVAELLEYDIRITERGDTLILEGEKHQDGTQVHRYFKVTMDASGRGEIRFEHFSSPSARDAELNKFVGLAQLLGVRIDVQGIQEAGKPIAEGEIHHDFLKGQEGS
ncbi:MAG: hypothetical protein AAB345_03300 [Patescibacteria group bacterium]